MTCEGESENLRKQNEQIRRGFVKSADATIRIWAPFKPLTVWSHNCDSVSVFAKSSRLSAYRLQDIASDDTSLSGAGKTEVTST